MCTPICRPLARGGIEVRDRDRVRSIGPDGSTARYPRHAADLLLTGILSIATAGILSAQAPDWSVGDVFLAVGDGAYHVYDRTGGYKHAIEDQLGGYTSDCGFNPALDRLYTLNYTRTRIVVYDDAAEHGVLQVVDPSEVSPGGHSGAIAFAADGDFYVGHPDGNALIHKYSSSGMLMATFEVPVDGRRGTNWVDLSSDQQTLYYTSAGRAIQRFDTGSATSLPDFAALPGDGHAEGLRLLPPGDGSGGMLVADGSDIKRLDDAGEVVQTYDAHDLDSWFAINLDPDGRSFWATDHGADQVCRFNLDTGLIERTFTAGPGNTVFGVCLKGELTAGVPQPGAGLAGALAFTQNVPNPFNPETEITYTLPEGGSVRLEVYNLLGQQVITLVHGELEGGTHTVIWSGRDAHGREVSSGVYFCRLAADGMVATRRMLLLK
jgi:sugar lactone lactonase YvrE